MTPLSYKLGRSFNVSREKLEVIAVLVIADPVKYVGNDMVLIPTELLFMSRYSALNVNSSFA
jgi:hypothetical protein